MTDAQRWELLPDFDGLAAGMACDEALLPELGRVAWAAAVLHRDVVRALEGVGGRSVAAPWDLSLAEAIATLRTAAEDRGDTGAVVADWCASVGAPAADSRDNVVYEIVHHERLATSTRPPGVHYGRAELVEVTGRLVNASQTLPTGTG